MSVTDPTTTAESSTEVLPYDPATIGMEDFDQSDMVMPRITIVHGDAQFKDSLTGEQFDTITCVPLGVVKQRVLWPAQLTDEPPFCKSLDFQDGLPDTPKFPWKASGFSLADHQDVEQPVLSCADCHLKEWDTHPTRPKAPWCSEQHTYAIVLIDTETGVEAPALITFSRTGLKPSKAYLTAFHRSKQPLFYNYLTLSLTALSKGTNDYAVPNFTKGGPTDKEKYNEYAAAYLSVRKYVQTPRFIESTDEAGNTVEPTPAAAASTNTTSAPINTTAAEAPAATPPAAPVTPTAPAPAASVPGGEAGSDVPF